MLQISIKYKIFVFQNNVRQIYIGCVVIQDHWDIPFTDAEIVKLDDIKNVFNITDDKFPCIEIAGNNKKTYVLCNHGSYTLHQNLIKNNSNFSLNPNTLYTCESPRKS